MTIRGSLAYLALTSLAFLASCSEGESARPGFETVQALVEETKARAAMLSGTAVVAIRGDEIVYEGYFGAADIGEEQPVDEDTVFYIASATKAFMGLAILLAEAQDEVSLETSLQELFPELEFPDIDAGAISVHHLLTHTSGIDNEPLTWAMSYTGLHSAETRPAMIAVSYPSAGASLGDFEYSNIGYNILAVWLDQQYGVDWRETFKKTILDPLGMERTTGFISKAETEGWATTQPYSYKVDEGKTPLYLRKKDSTMYSVGLLATARDTARFVASTMNEGVLQGERVIPADVLERQLAAQVETDGGYFDGYAYGWMTGERLGRDVRLHTGGFSGATALISFMPEEKLGVVVLHNENGLKANWLNSIAEEAAYAALLGQSPEEIDALVRDDIERLSARVPEAQQQVEDDLERRRGADYDFSLPITDYAARYSHSQAGSINVDLTADERLALSWGLLRGTGYPSDSLDEIDVDFRPGSFDKLSFIVEGETVTGLVFNGVAFTLDAER